MKKIKTWLINLPTFHHRIMMRYLRKRGWVVFYLEENARACKGVCWLDLYKQKMEEKKRKKENKC